MLLCSNSLTPQVSGLPVVVKIIDGRLMETSLTSLQHRGALSQHLCILYQNIDSFNLPLTLAKKGPRVMKTQVEFQIWNSS